MIRLKMLPLTSFSEDKSHLCIISEKLYSKINELSSYSKFFLEIYLYLSLRYIHMCVLYI